MIRKYKKTTIAIAASALLAIILFFTLGEPGSSTDDSAKCESGTFETVVSSVGEIQAIKSLDILVPEALSQREIRVYWLKIIDMAPEGTMVKKGDYVATLDPGDVENELKRVNDQLERERNTREEAKLDSSLRLSSSRADIRNARDILADRQLKVEQSTFESKAFQRQAQIELDRTQRQLDQKIRNYQKQQRRLELNIERISNDISQTEKRLNLLLELKTGLKITAPADGMLLYAKSWRGIKIKVATK
jgi:HlyD family secretion protein